MADRIRPIRPLAWLIAVSMAVAILLGLLEDGASAKTKIFKPVQQGGKAVIFKPRGLQPQAIKRASVKLHRKGRVIKKQLKVRRVRQALKKGKRIRVRKPREVRRAQLLIQVRPRPACTLRAFSARSQPGACWRPYSDASPFNRGVPSSTTLEPSSTAIVSRLTSWGPPGKHASGDAGTSGDWSHPVYYSQPTDPAYTVHCTEPWGTCDMEGQQVRIPAQAQPAGGSDSHLAVIDQQSGWEYDFYGVEQKSDGVLRAAWGGRTRTDGDGLGGGSTAADFGLAAGVIRPAELAAGSIRHALVISVQCTNGTSVWPATSSSGRHCSEVGLSDENAPAMGQHFYLEMSEAEIDALGVPTWQKAILRAMADYGMFVEDTGGSSWGLMYESGASVTSFGFQDPWERVGQQLRVPTWDDPGLGKTRFIYDFRSAVDWASKLRVAAPCVSAASC